jgi:hypothetical protein
MIKQKINQETKEKPTQKSEIIMILGDGNAKDMDTRLDAADFHVFSKKIVKFSLMLFGTRFEIALLEEELPLILKNGESWSVSVVWDIYSLFDRNVSELKNRNLTIFVGEIYGKRIKRVASFFKINDIKIVDSGETESFIFENMLRLLYYWKFSAKIMSSIAKRLKKPT